jgi:hypothetical protein
MLLMLPSPETGRRTLILMLLGNPRAPPALGGGVSQKRRAGVGGVRVQQGLVVVRGDRLEQFPRQVRRRCSAVNVVIVVNEVDDAIPSNVSSSSGQGPFLHGGTTTCDGSRSSNRSGGVCVCLVLPNFVQVESGRKQ